MRSSLALLLACMLATTISAAPAGPSPAASTRLECRAVGSTITTSTGTYQGKILSRVEQFLGVPYALPATGALRFAPPRPLPETSDTTVQSAIAFGPRCGRYTNGVVREDCLNLNVYRPQGTTNSSTLPVMIYIFGWSFYAGGANSYKPTNLVLHSKAIAKPVIIVTLDYRLGTLGFLVSPEFIGQGAANLGLQDQAAPFQWVQDHIAAFGGDPSKVTVFGQSAGAIAVGMYLSSIRHEGSTPLFRAAILESGAPGTSAAFDYTSSFPQFKPPTDETKYSLLLAATGCNSVPAEEQLGCLKFNATAEQILAGQGNVRAFGGFPYAPSIDGLTVPSLPSILYASGALRRVPLIVGTNLDEGPEFVSSKSYSSLNITTDPQLLAWLGSMFPSSTPANLAALLRFYGSSQSYRSPYNTGNVKYLWKQFKRASSLFGDLAFEAPRRALLAAANQWSEVGEDGRQSMPVWNYQFLQRATSEADDMGVSHGAEIPWVWSTASATTPEQLALRNSMSDYWITFANELDPNGSNVTKPASWPAYEQVKKSSMQFKIGAEGSGSDTSLFSDTFRASGIDFINANPSVFGQ